VLIRWTHIVIQKVIDAVAGTSLLGAGYCLYSSSTLFVLTLGSGVWGFTYDSIIGEFVLSHPDIRIPEEGKIYAFNEGNYQARALLAFLCFWPQDGWLYRTCARPAGPEFKDGYPDCDVHFLKDWPPCLCITSQVDGLITVSAGADSVGSAPQGWEPGLQEYIMDLKDPSKHGGKPYTSRYIGSLVGDFHRTLLYGGIYGYPGDKKNVNGKLRLLYECAPMSMIAEQVRTTIGRSYAFCCRGCLLCS